MRGTCQIPEVPRDSGAIDPGPADSTIRDLGPIDAGFFTFTWNDDIEPLVMRRCQSCHSNPPALGVPMSLVQYADTQVSSPNGGLIHDRMALRVASAATPMPPVGSPPLTSEEVNMIRIWSYEGAPLGPPPDAGFPDFGFPDLGVRDGGFPDAFVRDVGFPDQGVTDAARVDLGFPDAGFGDTGFPDAAAPVGATDPLFNVGGTPLLANGFGLLEGPVFSSTTSTLFFSDLVQDAIYELNPNNNNAVTPYRAPSGLSNGLVFSPNGDLWSAEYGRRRVARESNGVLTTVVGGVAGLAFSSPNDIIARSDGTIYFTDPDYGLAGRPREVPFNGLYRITPTDELVVEWAGVAGQSGPNGIALSPAEDVLYMGDVEGQVVIAFDVAQDGSLANRRGFARTRGAIPDGMAVDVEGNLYVTTGFGIEVYAPNGFFWGSVNTVGTPTNIVFSAQDPRLLFITTYNAVYSLQTNIPGPSR